MLDENDARLYKTYATISLYFAAARGEIQHSASILMRGMTNPGVFDERRLNGLGTYLYGSAS